MMTNIAIIPIRGNIQETTDPTKLENQDAKEEYVVGGAYALFLRISSIFGLAPLRFKPHGDGYIVSISIPMYIYSWILVTAFESTSLYVMMSGHEHQWDAAQFVTLYHAGSICAVVVGMSCAPCRMRKLFKSMSTIALVDQIIDAQYSKAKERRICRYSAIYTFIFTVIMFIDMVMLIVQSGQTTNNLAWRLAGRVNFILGSMVNMQFAFTVVSVRARFSAVNQILSVTANNLTVTNNERAVGPFILNIFARRVKTAGSQAKITVRDSGKDEDKTGECRLAVSLSEAVKLVSCLHGLLCDVVDDVSDSYGVILVVMLISTGFNLASCLYFLFTEYSENPESFFFLGICFWIISYLMTIIVLAEPCHRTSEERKKTVSIVSHMLAETPNQGALASRLKVFSRQLMNQRAAYMPMGFFTLNRSLLASSFGIVITHIVILLQLRDD